MQNVILVQPAPKSNVFLKPAEEKIFLSKTMTLFYKFVHLFFSLDFGFFDLDSAKVRLLAKYFVPLFSLAIYIGSLVYAFFEYSQTSQNIWHTFYASQYLTYTLILFVNQNQLYKCLCELKSIDSKSKVNSTAYNFEVKLILLALLSLFYGTFMTISYCYAYNNRSCLTPIWPAIFTWRVEVFHDLVSVINTFAFYSIHRRLEIFSIKLETDKTSLSSYHHLYKSFADIVETIKTSFDPLFTAALLFNIPDIMISIYNFVQQLKNNEVSYLSAHLVLKNIDVFETLVVTMAPALYASKLSSQAKKIKIILYDKWLQVQDPVEARDIVKFIDYVEARPLTFDVYEIIPLNANLLSMVLKFCVTYLIVIIQFTHLY